MPAQAQFGFAVGEDVVETVNFYGPDGTTTVSVSGWALELDVTNPGGITVITKSTAAGNIAAATPLPYQASVTFSAGDTTVSTLTPPGYYDFQVRRTDAGSRGETTAGTLFLTP